MDRSGLRPNDSVLILFLSDASDVFDVIETRGLEAKTHGGHGRAPRVFGGAWQEWVVDRQALSCARRLLQAIHEAGEGHAERSVDGLGFYNFLILLAPFIQ